VAGHGPSLAPTHLSHLKALLELRRLPVMEALTRALLEGGGDARSEVLGEVLLLNEAIRFRRDARKALRAELDICLTLAAASGSLALQRAVRRGAVPALPSPKAMRARTALPPERRRRMVRQPLGHLRPPWSPAATPSRPVRQVGGRKRTEMRESR